MHGFRSQWTGFLTAYDTQDGAQYLELKLARVAAMLTLGDVGGGRHWLLGRPQRRRTRIETIPDHLCALSAL